MSSVSMRQSDKATAVVLALLGGGMFWGGYHMDRLEFRHIHPASIPGLVPMGLGLLLVLCAVILFRSAQASQDPHRIDSNRTSALMTTAILGLVYALGLVGHVPFFLATVLFISGFVAVFTWPDAAGTRPRVRALLIALVFGGLMAAGVSALFRYGFLVRLP